MHKGANKIAKVNKEEQNNKHGLKTSKLPSSLQMYKYILAENWGRHGHPSFQ